MIVESENMKKLRERNLLAEIRAKTIVIQDAPPRTPDTKELMRQLEHESIIDEIFGED